MSVSATKDLSVALIALVVVLLVLGVIFMITLAAYIRKGRGYNVETGENGNTNGDRPANGQSTNVFLNQAYAMEKVTY